VREELGGVGSWRRGGLCGNGGGTLDPLDFFFFFFENAEKDDGGCWVCTVQSRSLKVWKRNFW
jgi:hypothetical protein